MNNEDFLKVIKKSFNKYLETGSRSNSKLKILHGAITSDLNKRLENCYQLHSLGYNDDKELNMKGRYMDKKVDIAVSNNKEVIAGIALKFIMRNYSQNSNNYFENMLSETANIRSVGKPYFQIVIIPSKIPYFKNDGVLDHVEVLSENNLKKYIKLSHDNVLEFMHTPTKTLIYLIDMPEIPFEKIKNYDDYKKYYQENEIEILESNTKYDFGSSVIYNDYNKFIDKIVHYIKYM